MLIDLLVVGVFVVVGRRTHDEGNAVAAAVVTAAPFVLALASAWLLVSLVRPRVGVTEGLMVSVITAGTGTFLRRVVFDEGVAFPFVLVTTAFLVAGMIGWRLLATARPKARARTAGTTTASR